MQSKFTYQMLQDAVDKLKQQSFQDEMIEYIAHQQRRQQEALLKEKVYHIITPIEVMEKGKTFRLGYEILIHPDDMYKYFFLNNDVSDRTVAMAIEYAISRVHKWIDEYKV